jgi:hypothetical protein
MLSSIVATMAQNELSGITGLLKDLQNFQSSAKRLAIVEADRSGIQSHSIGDAMIKALEPARVQLWRGKAVAHCETELNKVIKLLANCGELDNHFHLIDKCETELRRAASIAND